MIIIDFADLVKRALVSVVGEIRRYRSDRYDDDNDDDDDGVSFSVDAGRLSGIQIKEPSDQLSLMEVKGERNWR